MSTTVASLSLVALVALAGIGTAPIALAGSLGDAVEPVRCEIQASASGKMLEIEAVLHSAVALDGTYTLNVKKVASANSADIDQGGDFTAAAGESVTLGKVMFGGNGEYDVSLEIDAPGADLKCEQRFASPT